MVARQHATVKLLGALDAATHAFPLNEREYANVAPAIPVDRIYFVQGIQAFENLQITWL